MRKILATILLFAAACISCGVGGKMGKEFQVRCIWAKLVEIEPITREGREEHIRLHFREENGWKLPFYEDGHPIEDTMFFQVGGYYLIHLKD